MNSSARCRELTECQSQFVSHASNLQPRQLHAKAVTFRAISGSKAIFLIVRLAACFYGQNHRRVPAEARR
jgi:hypothetical protein